VTKRGLGLCFVFLGVCAMIAPQGWENPVFKICAVAFFFFLGYLGLKHG
jgi:hypothetical protein